MNLGLNVKASFSASFTREKYYFKRAFISNEKIKEVLRNLKV